MTYSGYIGTYTKNSRSQGIYYFRLDSETGTIEELRPAARAVNPSWLCLSPRGTFLYAANEIDSPEGGSAVSAYRIGAEGSLEFISQKKSNGKSLCHLAIDNAGTFIIGTNYHSGSVAVFPLENSGCIAERSQFIQFNGNGPNRERQEGPHAHSTFFDRNFRFAFVCDLGSDRIMAYDFDPTQTLPLRPAEIPWFTGTPGSGPRHGVFNREGVCAYSVNELDSTVETLKIDPPKGTLTRLQRLSTLPPASGSKVIGSETKNFPAAIRVSPDNEFVFVSNRGHDSIAVFRIQKNGLLEFLGAFPSGGKTPRDIMPAPSGSMILSANQDSDTLSVFRIEKNPFSLIPLDSREVPAPSCVVFVDAPV